MYAIDSAMARQGLLGKAQLRLHQRDTRPIADAIHAWLTRHKDLLATYSLGKVVRYCLNHWEFLTLFIDNPNVPIQSNCSERAPEDTERLRFNSHFTGSTEGGHRWAVLLGVDSTARRIGLDLRAYPTWMFERRGTRKDDVGLTAAQLTLAAYKLMLEGQGQERVVA
jgi:transposase